MCRGNKMNKRSSEEVKRTVGVRVVLKIFNWFGYVKLMTGKPSTRGVYESYVKTKGMEAGFLLGYCAESKRRAVQCEIAWTA